MKHPLMLHLPRLLLPALILLSGVCALRGQCGKKSFFGTQLPCPDNTPATEPGSKTRKRLVEICGDAWKEGPVCCEDDQLEDLSKNLKRAEALIASCPACKANFFDLFCSFTCSPDQSLFLNVTTTQTASTGKEIVTELDYLVSPSYGSGFFDSCKDVKFSGTNGYAMELVGGGAKDYPAFLKFLGDEKPFGSPFQINFPPEDKLGAPMRALDHSPKRCNDGDVAYRCSCVDCPAVCPTLQEVEVEKECKVGVIPCLSFAVILIYSISLFTLVAFTAAEFCGNLGRGSFENSRLLQDSAPSDDEDEGDVVGAGRMDRPYREYFLNSRLDDLFSWLGNTCASFPAVTISASVIIVGLLSLGWLRFSIETDPVRLWVSPTSEAALEKKFFDDNFDPFYRTQQVFLVNDNTEAGASPVLSYDVLSWWFDVENRIRRLKSLNYGVTLDDVCLKPTDSGCVVQSVAGYFGNSFWNVKEGTWRSDLRSCAAQPVQSQCLPDFGQPLNKDLILGGWQDTGDVVDSKAMIVTWVLNNHAEGSKELVKTMDWEQSLKSTLLAVQGEARERGLRLSFSTEVSLEEELNKSTNTDAKIVVVSYIAMFIYASFALGSTSLTISHVLSQSSKLLVESKFTLGIFGIIIVLMSVSASVGLFSAMGVKVTLIIAEVIPFLVLAVGVDNIFLIVHEFERVNYSHQDQRVEVRVGKAMGRMGPSILLSATCETIAFALGAVVSMPAVRNFAIYAAGAVFVNALLQVTMFVAVLSLNQKRVESNRMDCFPCFRAPGGYESNGSAASEGVLQKFIRKGYAPALLQKQTKRVVMALFLGLFTAGVALLPKVELGLDQRIAIPSDSYLIGYFNDLYDYLGVGPPVYFVTRNYNVTSREAQQSLCGHFSTCDTFSLSNVLEQERKRPEISYIAEPVASWIDDFFLWLNPSLDKCCRVKKKNPSELCDELSSDRVCKVCFEDRDLAWNITLNGMPEGGEFLGYLDIWLQAPTGEECPVAGKAAYSHAIVPDHDRRTIKASHFRTSHTALRSQKDFINAYASARRISELLSHKSGLEVFPYSKFYIFFDQYSSIVGLTEALLLAALACIFLVSSILLGSAQTGLVVSATVLMIVVDILGIMALWGVSLNAVSLVNLVICVGIGVEFCSHVARAFMFPSRSAIDRARSFRGKDARALSALTNVGGSVFSGITVTKLIGVCVLAFTRSKIFEIYYFRMWLALVIVAATHALVFLPVVLSYLGGEGYVPDDSYGGLEEDLRSRTYRNLVPADYDDSSEED
ncbi:multidrug efflux transporter AcrB transmembrane domain-containing protein [Tuber magnatum]|uniref:Multidrug efflux transporter AcrB transmembrane domain-containing protein n=1 Tax=Tuber magnatum TaxID=42249 RepID=A0A317T298_9PEZI|nr:multidrug efflux transporter AcrB transmembrane domain-containing protein [Tuber magnatum]